MVRRISVTMLSSYIYCKRKLFLERVLGLFELEKEALVKGTIRHETYDKVNQIEEELVKSITEKDNYNTIYQKYFNNYGKLLRKVIIANKYRLTKINLSLVDAYHQIIPFFKQESELRALNLMKFIEKNNYYGIELWDNLIPKIESEYKIESDELELKGIVDQIEKYPDGMIPIELKTGSMPKEGVWPGHRIQLGAYALLMESKLNIPIKEGFVVYLDKQERRHIVINPFLKDEVRELKNKVRELVNGLELPEKEKNENKCAKCGLKNQCFNEEHLKLLITNKKL